MSAFWVVMLVIGIVLVPVNLVTLARSRSSIGVGILCFVSLGCAVYLISASLLNLRVFS